MSTVIAYLFALAVNVPFHAWLYLLQWGGAE